MPEQSEELREFLSLFQEIKEKLVAFEEDLSDLFYSHTDFIANSFVISFCSIGETYFRSYFTRYIKKQNKIFKDNFITIGLIKFGIEKNKEYINKEIHQISDESLKSISLNLDILSKNYLITNKNFELKNFDQDLKDKIEGLVKRRNEYAHSYKNVDCNYAELLRYAESLREFIIQCDEL